MSFHKITCGIPFVDLSPSLRLLKSVQMFKSKKKKIRNIFVLFYLQSTHHLYQDAKLACRSRIWSTKDSLITDLKKTRERLPKKTF